MALKALQRLGVYGIGRTVSSEDLSYVCDELNMMLKYWQTKGLHLFTKTEGVLYLTPGTSPYSLGSTAKATKSSDEVISLLNGDVASGSAALTVDSTSGMTIGDVLGVVLADKTIHWTTVATIPTSTTMTASAVLTGAANDNALVYTYTTALEKPLRVLSARKRTGSGENISDTILSEMSYQDYQELPVKNSTGSSPTQFAFNPNNTNSTMYLWPCPSDGAERIQFTYERKIEDMDNTSDDFDLPSEWLLAIEFNLASLIARPFGKASAVKDVLPMAQSLLDDLLDWDAEHSTIEISPQIENY